MLNQNEYCSFEEALLADFQSLDRTDPAVARFIDRWDKRFVSSDQVKSLHLDALNKLKSLNEQVVPPLIGDIDPVIIGEAQSFIYDALCKFTWSYSEVRQCELDWTSLFDLWKFGPGASNGVQATHFCDKITKRMTCTEKCLPLVRLLRKLTPRIRAFDSRKPSVERVVLVKGSRASSVRKNRTTNRTMAIEPSGNMAFQLAAGAYIEGALRRVGLDITTQEEKNKLLAWRGSLNGSLCTIDLSSASDLISIELIKLLWPQSWYQLFMTLRSPECKVGDDWIKLNMMSTMGNGFTFPMMTLTLLAVIYGYQRSVNLLPSRKIDYKVTGVYGDDIIMSSYHYVPFVKLLENLGLRVNLDKSFSSGPFRESCGGDYYLGAEITPPYVESLQDPSEVYVAMNKLLKWSSNHRVLLMNSLTYLRGLISGNIYLVPEWEDPSSGILSLYPKRRYKKLIKQLEPDLRSLRSDLDFMCVIGGFATVLQHKSKSKGDRQLITWTSREAKSELRVVKARLPKGFLDGHDPNYSDRATAGWRWQVISLLAS